MLATMKMTTALIIWSLSFLAVQSLPLVAHAQAAMAVPEEDYSLYDQINEDNFLTAQIQLILLEGTTVSRLVPDQDDSMTMDFLRRQGCFDGMLPLELVRDFAKATQISTRLEGRFQFRVRYRFISDGTTEDSEAGAPGPLFRNRAVSVQGLSVLDRLAFSRVGRTLGNDQALVYVGKGVRMGSGQVFSCGIAERDRSGSRSSGQCESKEGGGSCSLALAAHRTVACLYDDGVDSENLPGPSAGLQLLDHRRSGHEASGRHRSRWRTRTNSPRGATAGVYRQPHSSYSRPSRSFLSIQRNQESNRCGDLSPSGRSPAVEQPGAPMSCVRSFVRAGFAARPLADR